MQQPLRPAHAFLSSTASWKLGVPRHKRYLQRFLCRRQAAGFTLVSIVRGRHWVCHFRPIIRRSRCSTALTRLNDGFKYPPPAGTESATALASLCGGFRPTPAWRSIARISTCPAASAKFHAAGSLLPAGSRRRGRRRRRPRAASRAAPRSRRPAPTAAPPATRARRRPRRLAARAPPPCSPATPVDHHRLSSE